MKKIILFVILFFSYVYGFSQDCITQKSVSDAVICTGENASIVLSDSEIGVNYQLRIGATDVGGPIPGSGTDLTFTVAPTDTTIYNIYMVECDLTYNDTATVTVNPLPDAGISGDTTICDSSSAAIDLFGLITAEQAGGLWSRTSGTGGTFDATAGTFTPAAGATSSIFTYTITGIAPCINDSSMATVNITAIPTATISYATPFCTSDVLAKAVTIVGTGAYSGGSYSATAGLSINPITGAITPNISTAGTYIVTYTIPASAGCSSETTTTTVTITGLPTAIINYVGNPFCKSVVTAQPVTISGTGAYTGGTYSSTAGLSINMTTGFITPNTSIPGTYTVTYTIPTSLGCSTVSVATTATITPVPTAAITYSGNPFCKSVTSAQGVTLTGSGAYTGGTYSSTAGLSINSGTGAITPDSSTAGTYIVTYTIPASAGCSSAAVTTSVTITTAATATINYANAPFCKSLASAQTVTLTGTGPYTGGTYSSAAGLSINATTGAITPGSSTAGTHIVTYTIPANTGCPAIPVTTSVTITAVPTATISYAALSFCKSVATAQTVTLTGTGAYTGGTYSSSPSGLTIDSASGAITPSSSSIKTYTITYSIPASAGCSAGSVTTTVNITATPTATISYIGSPYCKSIATAQSITLSGTGAYTGGTYSSTAGLTINATTGAITPSTSTAGLYTVTYTNPASAGCLAVTATATVTITAVSTATINYTGTPFCKSLVSAQAVTLTGTGNYTGGTYNSTGGLSLNSGTGAITPSSSTAGTYIVTYTIPANAGCPAVPVTTSVTITAIPTATITYAGTPFCKSIAAAQSVTLTGTGAYSGGTYSAAAGLTINATTGAITPSTSTAGTYTVTYTIPASAGCSAVPVITNVTVTAVPTAIINYPGTPFCKSGTSQTVTLAGTGAYTSGTYSSTVGLTINATTGAINPSTSTAGTFTVTYTIPASAGCSPVPVTTSVTVTAVPTATIIYSGTPFCKSIGTAQPVTLIGTGAYTGGVYSSTAGLIIDATTGAITPSSSVVGTYTVTYTVPASAGCPAVAVTRNITITAIPTATISYTSAPFCKSNATPQAITLTGTGAYTGGTYSSTSGLTINSSTGLITPSTSTAGVYTVTYIIPANAGCSAVPVTTNITINAQPNAGTDGNTTICDSSLTATDLFSLISSEQVGGVWSRTSGTGGVFNAGAGTFTPAIGATTSTFNYTIPGTAPCINDISTGTITIKPTPIATATPATQTICSGNLITTMVLSGSVGSTTFNWTRDNTVSVTGISPGGSGNISGSLTNTTNSPIIVTFTITPTANGCVGLSIIATIQVEAAYEAGLISVSLPGNVPVVTLSTACHSDSGNLYLSGHIGTIIRWESSTSAGTSWSDIGNSNTTTYNYSNIVQTTLFRAVIQNSSLLCPEFYSAIAIVNVIPNIKPTPVTATPSTICVGDSSILSSQSGYATSGNLATGGNFSSSNPTGWLADGCGNCLNASGSNGTPAPFYLTNSNGTIYSGIGYMSSGKFVIAHGNFNSILETPVFNTLGLSTASLSFDHAYNLLVGAWTKVEISLDGGTTYATLLAQYNGVGSRSPYINFPNTTINLNSYLGQTNLRIRFNYHGTVGSSWAIDNIKIPDTPQNLSAEWVDTSTGQVISNSANVTVSPTVTTTYEIVSVLNGCNSYGPEGTTYVTVTVNERPTAVIGNPQTICNGGTATFSVALTGTSPWSITYSDGSTPTTVNNITSNPYVFSVPNITADKTFTITALNDSKCAAQPQYLTGSPQITVLNGAPGIWTGSKSNDWFDCLNWAGGLPSSTANANIPSGSSNMPIIDYSSSAFAIVYGNTAKAQDLNIESGASLTMAANSELQISGNWKNSGAFNPGTGTVIFNSAVTNQIQTVNSNIKTQEIFYNLTLSNSNGANGISLDDGFELTVANNLSLLSGDLRLTGEAQLVQSGTTANPSAGSGKLLRDQQGIKNSFHYDYWSSPVSSDNISYSIAEVLRDGTNNNTAPFSPSLITFGEGAYFADGPATNPIKISNRWLYKYTALPNSYFSWQHIGNTGTVKVGEGYTMKGTDGTASFLSQQNYVFVGKPNNGTITLNIDVNQSYLIGNPYPSALNADEFIKDNIKDGGRAVSNVFNGALYFWDHFGGNSHYASAYVGGYATYTLMGGVVAIANNPLNINDGSMGIKVPQKFIPVGQGFFIETNLDPSLIVNNPGLSNPVSGGTVIIKNSQRAFKIESATNSVFFKQENSTVSSTIDEDHRPKIRLKFDSPSGLHRQILVGADPNTTNLFDIGYDAPIIDINANDMYWEFSDSKFVIQAVPDFNSEQIIPLGIKLVSSGVSTIKIEALENVPDNTEIYIHDNVTGNYTDVKNGNFTASLPTGEYTNRFSLRFQNRTLDVNQNNAANGITVFFTNINNTLNINNHTLDITVNTVSLFNLLSQPIAEWNVTDKVQEHIQVPIKNLKSGTYIVKVKTTYGVISKKIIIR